MKHLGREPKVRTFDFGNKDEYLLRVPFQGHRAALIKAVGGKPRGVQADLLNEQGKVLGTVQLTRKIQILDAPEGTAFVRLTSDRDNSVDIWTDTNLYNPPEAKKDPLTGIDRQALYSNINYQTHYQGTPEGEVLRLTNEIRVKHGLRPFETTEPLTSVAEVKSWDMGQRDYFAHTTPEGQTIYDRADIYGIPYSANRPIAENIAAGYTTPAAVVKAWMDSPGHRANMLSPSVNKMGVGYALIPSDTGNLNYTHYWTQEFSA